MATFNKLTRTLAPIRGAIKRGYYESKLAKDAVGWSKSVAKNALGTSKGYVHDANIIGRDAAFTASRTIKASSFNGRSIATKAAMGAGIGAAANVGSAYMNGDRDYGRAGVRGAFLGAGAGAAFGVGSSLRKGYLSQAETRFKGGVMHGPQLAMTKGPMYGPKPATMGYRMKKAVYGSGLLGGLGIS